MKMIGWMRLIWVEWGRAAVGVWRGGGRDAGVWGVGGEGCVEVWCEREPGLQWRRLYRDEKLGGAPADRIRIRQPRRFSATPDLAPKARSGTNVSGGLCTAHSMNGGGGSMRTQIPFGNDKQEGQSMFGLAAEASAIGATEATVVANADAVGEGISVAVVAGVTPET